MKEFILDKKHFNKDDWNFCITCRPGWDIPLDFTYEDDCLKNKLLPKEQAIVDDFEYISVVSKEGFAPENLWVELDCKFDSFGAPCMVFSGEWEKNEKGLNVYQHHYEFCGYERGLNVWDIDSTSGTLQARPAAKTLFPMVTNEKFTIRGEFFNGYVKAIVGDYSVQIPLKLPEKIHIGFTACEGINSFYAIRFGKLDEK